MRKIIALFLTVMLCLSFSSCGKSKDVIPAEDALPAVPEVVGEWGSIFFSEESLMTIREDGTCTVLRQPGTWGVHKDFSLWPTILIIAQLDNGKEEQIEFYMYQGEDLGYPEGTLTIKNSELPPAAVVNRTHVVHPVKEASFVLGTWVDGNSTDPFATFNEDGTCEILGAKGLWGLNYAPYYNEDFGYGWDHYLFAQINGQTWKVHVDEGESGKSTFSISNGPMKIVDTTEAKNLSRSNEVVASQTESAVVNERTDEITETEAQYTQIEITIENWADYFNIVAVERIEENAFGEVDFWTTDWSISLKEEYESASLSEDLALELCYTLGTQDIIVDYENRTYSLTGEYNTMMNCGPTVFELKNGFYYLVSDSFVADEDNAGHFNLYPHNFEATRAQGYIYLP